MNTAPKVFKHMGKEILRKEGGLVVEQLLEVSDNTNVYMNTNIKNLIYISAFFIYITYIHYTIY